MEIQKNITYTNANLCRIYMCRIIQLSEIMHEYILCMQLLLGQYDYCILLRKFLKFFSNTIKVGHFLQM